VNIPVQDPLAATVGQAIRAGDIDKLKRLLVEIPNLALARIVDACGVSRTLLHVVADWPGHFPNGAVTVGVLAEAGADVNARVMTPDPKQAPETPLHWAASSDDVAVLDALLDTGADIEAPGACIAGGTPLDDAVAFGQWQTARRLVARGAQTALWHSAALGLLDEVAAHLAGSMTPARYPWGKSGGGASPEEITVAFWCACHGGQLETAAYLLDRGAPLNWISPWDHLTPLDAAQRAGADELVRWLRGQGAMSAREVGSQS